MAETNETMYAIDKLHLFPTYNTREDYFAATGKVAPEFNPNQDIKTWLDPKAAESTRRNVVYDQVLVTNQYGSPTAGPDGKPSFDVLVLAKEVAATINVPDRDTPPGMASRPTTPVPLRELKPEEELIFIFGGNIAVRNKQAFQKEVREFTPFDREILMKIAERLGVQ
jgi:hypothetical protein